MIEETNNKIELIGKRVGNLESKCEDLSEEVNRVADDNEELKSTNK